jgi:hypothetical protein
VSAAAAVAAQPPGCLQQAQPGCVQQPQPPAQKKFKSADSSALCAVTLLPAAGSEAVVVAGSDAVVLCLSPVVEVPVGHGNGDVIGNADANDLKRFAPDSALPHTILVRSLEAHPLPRCDTDGLNLTLLCMDMGTGTHTVSRTGARTRTGIQIRASELLSGIDDGLPAGLPLGLGAEANALGHRV